MSRLLVTWASGHIEVIEAPTRMTAGEALALARLLRTGAIQVATQRRT